VLIRVVWELVTVGTIHVVTVAITITVGPLCGVEGICVRVVSLRVVTIAITVRIGVLSCIVREVINRVDMAVTVAVEIEQHHVRHADARRQHAEG